MGKIYAEHVRRPLSPGSTCNDVIADRSIIYECKKSRTFRRLPLPQGFCNELRVITVAGCYQDTVDPGPLNGS